MHRCNVRGLCSHRRMHTNRLFFVLGAVALGAVLYACGGDPATAKGANPPAPAASSTETNTTSTTTTNTTGGGSTTTTDTSGGGGGGGGGGGW